MLQSNKLRTLAEAIGLIADGDIVALGGDATRNHPMAAVREIARQHRRGLHVVGWNNGIDVDLLVGAGCVATVETSAVGIGSIGFARNYHRALGAGGIRVIDHSEATALDRFRAAAMGLPLLPTKTAFGTDLPAANPHLKPFQDPFTGATCIAVEAVRPDVAIIHAHTADAGGNVQFGSERSHDSVPDVMIARSARTVIVTVEQIVSEEAVSSCPTDTILPGAGVTCIVEAPYGAHPCRCDARYDEDVEHLGRYHAATETPDGFAGWLADVVFGIPDHSAYIDRVGSRMLLGLTTRRTGYR